MSKDKVFHFTPQETPIPEKSFSVVREPEPPQPPKVFHRDDTDLEGIIGAQQIGEDDYPDIKDPKEQACFYLMERAATKYAKRFFRLLCSHELTNESVLPIVFRDECEAIYHADETGYVHGRNLRSKWYPKQGAIEIILPRRSKNTYLHKSLKETIRHEVIHYYLWMRDLPSDDNTALFWAYCYIFDAGAYEPLSEEEQEKYNAFVDKAKDAFSIRSLPDLAEGIILNDSHSLELFEQSEAWRRQLKEDHEKLKQQNGER